MQTLYEQCIDQISINLTNNEGLWISANHNIEDYVDIFEENGYSFDIMSIEQIIRVFFHTIDVNQDNIQNKWENGIYYLVLGEIKDQISENITPFVQSEPKSAQNGMLLSDAMDEDHSIINHSNTRSTYEEQLVKTVLEYDLKCDLFRIENFQKIKFPEITLNKYSKQNTTFFDYIVKYWHSEYFDNNNLIYYIRHEKYIINNIKLAFQYHKLDLHNFLLDYYVNKVELKTNEKILTQENKELRYKNMLMMGIMAVSAIILVISIKI